MALLPVAEHRGEDAECRRRGHRDVEPSHLELQGPAHLAAGALRVPQRGARLAQQLLAGGGQPHAAGQALDELARMRPQARNAESDGHRSGLAIHSMAIYSRGPVTRQGGPPGTSADGLA